MSFKRLTFGFSRHLMWSLLVIIGILILPSIITHINNAADSDGQLRAQKRRFRQIFQEVKIVIDAGGAKANMNFPDCIAVTEIAKRDLLTIKFFSITNLAEAAPNTILCESKSEYSGRHLILLRDGAILFKDSRGRLFPIDFGP